MNCTSIATLGCADHRMRVVKITPDMRVVAAMLGSIRAMINRSSGVKDAKIGKQDGFVADQDAIIGELAFAKLFNVWPDLSLSARSGSYDMLVGRSRVDVKTTREPNGRLLSTLKANPDVDVYVLAVIAGDEVRFPGYAKAKDLIHESRITDLGHGKTYAMRQADLRQWDTMRKAA